MKVSSLLARRWPITVRIPLFLGVLMVAVSATLSEQVLHRLEQDQGERLEISDTGNGMPEATVGTLGRCDESAGLPQGNAGLGAWTVARLVGRLNGSIEVLSSLAGTTVAVTLPLAAEERRHIVA